ncbi:hypothetical protein KL935_000840 [Ogataea polymorpha]|uniref:Altered inheritance of mitochondria protein 32 n=1 Tax=Ogataea polymorpha TaxID=460523 RepID=A0A1B7SLF0_9ASCO|nr:uncharacterized protein OGAPODRAFT_92602 [Ogataea polymorpha]KAG7892891.1 hypothetical protein KL936_001065 [Ogataea polymorpha]KAG7903308.1 hypothetical protein KL935_000840 [Ogataea polymorpha]KAG7920150.1 hypothetical protein KL927_000830 [Ogataea polymorpha]KAG7938257.1 hypothetical protein KL934_000831 [Ogataea polymorpha]KAH3669901.1 hypothetical protein OGATHE_002713 [Ogataea polymorpha]
MLRQVCVPRRFYSLKRPLERVPTCPEPEIDTGCTYCKIPTFPKNKQLDHTKPIANTKSNPWKHLIVMSGDPDYKNWPSRFETSPGTIISEIQAHKRKVLDPFHPVLTSMTTLQEQPVTQGNTVIGIYPDGLRVEVSPDKVEEFLIGYLSTIPDNLDQEDSRLVAKMQQDFRAQFPAQKLDQDLVLICGHLKRDIRCGELAPLIAQEFEKVLKLHGVENTKLGMISHIGGHVYAGNVLIFKRNGDVIWYGRVLPHHVQGIVKLTLLENKLIEELYRG